MATVLCPKIACIAGNVARALSGQSRKLMPEVMAAERLGRSAGNLAEKATEAGGRTAIIAGTRTAR